jgi:molybdate transport system permease protein
VKVEDAPGDGVPPAVAAASAPLLGFILLPLVVLVLSVPPGALLGHLRSALVLEALRLTLLTTAVATALCAVLGLPVAWLLARGRFRGAALLDTLVDLPITIPPVVGGVALLLCFGRRGPIGRLLEEAGVTVAFSTTAVVMAQVFIACPFFIKAARAGFEAVDRRLEQAARTLGSSPWRTFWTVSVPLARPALVAGLALAWARALSEFGATMMFAGNLPGRTQTLTLAVMTALESDVEAAAAVSLVSLALAVVALVGARAVGGRWVRAFS